jgi:hypothetical protein
VTNGWMDGWTAWALLDPPPFWMSVLLATKLSNSHKSLSDRTCQCRAILPFQNKKEKELAGKGWVYGHLIKWVL